MEYVLYADVLFIVNFSMDYVTLYLTSSLLHLKRRMWRMLLASSLGALGGVLCAVYIRSPLFTSIFGVLLCAAMTYAAYGSAPLFPFFRRTAAVWGSGAFIGGVVTAAASCGRGISGILPGVIVGGITAAVALSRFTGGGAPKSAEIEISLCGRSLKLTAMTDSGNLLKEPISGRPVVLLSDSAASRLVGTSALEAAEEKLSPEFERRFRLIPYRTVEGAGMLRGFMPDRIAVEGSECDAVFAVERGGSYGGYEALVPAVLVKADRTRKPEAKPIEAKVTAGRNKK